LGANRGVGGPGHPPSPALMSFVATRSAHSSRRGVHVYAYPRLGVCVYVGATEHRLIVFRRAILCVLRVYRMALVAYSSSLFVGCSHHATCLLNRPTMCLSLRMISDPFSIVTFCGSASSVTLSPLSLRRITITGRILLRVRVGG